MGGGIDTTVFAAFGVGMLSFFSPCVLPLVPGYLSAISGVSMVDTNQQSRVNLLGPALLFVLSFTAIFMALGLGATGIGQSLASNRELLQKISGAMIILMGVLMLGMLVVPRLNRDWRPRKLAASAGTGGPIIAGAAFAIAWTPCVGPTLGAILTAASATQDYTQGAILLLFYSAGLALPFLAAALGLSSMDGLMRWMKRHHVAVTCVSSAILITVGTLILTDEFFRLNIEAQKLTRSLGIGL
ncbi:MAG: sulfite exporter TauE/SafE family protein [Thermoleophilaceae bacterium]|nr:sulfite exporter TauE/SafE family protein [Thermoleophilaceae bacterium]